MSLKVFSVLSKIIQGTFIKGLIASPICFQIRLPDVELMTTS